MGIWYSQGESDDWYELNHLVTVCLEGEVGLKIIFWFIRVEASIKTHCNPRLLTSQRTTSRKTRRRHKEGTKKERNPETQRGTASSVPMVMVVVIGTND